MTNAPLTSWHFWHFGLIVTGKSERDFVTDLLRPLMESGNCTFKVIKQVPQLGPRTSPKRKLRVTGTERALPDRDAEIGLTARAHLAKPQSFVILIDDLEHDRRASHRAVYDRYRNALDALLSADLQPRASVHFFVNMLEAYYFADAQSINAVCGTQLSDHDGDVEDIRHPKNDLKRAANHFNERQHGKMIVSGLNMDKVLGDPSTCASLRTLFKWCVAVKGEEHADRFQLALGACSAVTGGQIPENR